MMKLVTLLMLLALLVGLISAVSLAQGKKKANPSETVEIGNPLKNSDRIEVELLPDGKYRLNKEKELPLQELSEKLRGMISGRPPDRRAVIVHAPPEMQYGLVVRALDAANSVGAMPIFPYVETQEGIAKFYLVSELTRDRSISVVLPTAASARDDVYLQHQLSVVVTIPDSGSYFVGEKRLNVTGKISEQELASHIRAGLKKLSLEIPRNVYVRCALNAPYSDVSLLLRAIDKAGAEEVMLVTVKK